MRLGILHSDYVYRPTPDWVRAKMSAAHRERLGIPDGHVRIYGVHVLQERREPLRTYAADIARRKGCAAAKEFVLAAVRSNHEVENPYPPRPVALGPYLPPREFARLKMLHRFVRAFHLFVRLASGTASKRYVATGDHPRKVDWDLAAALIDDGATEADLVALFNVNAVYFRHQARKRGMLHGRRNRRRDR